MPPASIFAVPHAGPLVLLRKRKSDQLDDGEVEQDDEGPPEPIVRSTEYNVSAITSLSAERAREYQTAGFDPEDAVPLYPFPHKPVRKRTQKLQDVDQELTELNPPVDHHGLTQARDEVSVPSPGAAHLSALTAILHQALLKGDYQRAGRAWRILLCSGSESDDLRRTMMDLRPRGRWAIGGEILLRKGYQGTQRPYREKTDEPLPQDSSVQPPSSVNLRAAREYYDRLAVQYPFRVNRVEKPTDFHLAMLSLWIYEASEYAKAERQKIEQDRDDDMANGSATRASDDIPESDSSSIPSNSSIYGSPRSQRIERAYRQRLDEVRRGELRSALEIAARLDDIRISPPFDKSPDLLHLRAMISLWAADLLVSEAWPANVDAGERRQRELDREQELRKAKRFLSDAVKNGATLREGMELGEGSVRGSNVESSEIGERSDL